MQDYKDFEGKPLDMFGASGKEALRVLCRLGCVLRLSGWEYPLIIFVAGALSDQSKEKILLALGSDCLKPPRTRHHWIRHLDPGKREPGVVH